MLVLTRRVGEEIMIGDDTPSHRRSGHGKQGSGRNHRTLSRPGLSG
jgi:hypothetical protein